MSPRRALAVALLFAALFSAACTRERSPGDGFVVLAESAPQTLDPRLVIDDVGTKISNLIFAGLVTFDTPDSALELVLAERLEQRSPLVWAVTLKPGLTFHDGSPLTADDVRFTFTSTPSRMAHLERIEVLDERNLEFHLKEPYAPFETELASGIVSRAEIEARGARAATLGAGPYRLVEGPGEVFTVLERFEDYVGGPPTLERVVVRVVRDDNARIISLLGGSADLALNNVTPLMLPVVQEDEGLVVESAPSIKYSYLMFNTRVAPLDDVRVRQAIALAIDREEIIEYKFRGLAQLASGMLAPSHWAYEPQVVRWQRDVERARALLDAAGLVDPDGAGPRKRFTLTWRTSSSHFRRSIAELIAAQLAEVGIGVEIESMEFGTFFTQIHAGNFELASLQWPSPQEPDLMYLAFHSSMVPWEHPQGHGRNRGGYRNDTLDAVLEAARREPDRDTRRRHYQHAQRILAEDLPYVPLWHEDNITVMRRGTRGFVPTPNARLRALESTTRAPR